MCALDFDLFNLTKGDTTAERDGVLFGSGAPPDFFQRGGHVGATKNIAGAQPKNNFQFYYAVVRYRLLEKYGKNYCKKRIICLGNFLLIVVVITENGHI